jgi:A/G-specific adenine glycosylase
MARVPNPTPQDIAPLLLRWFSRNRRDLPWRRTQDPYRIWVSEVMLQQTQVERVIPFYQRFVKRFPTAAKLAAAPLDEVLRHWAGLGYYSRARNLHAACRALIARNGGSVPDDHGEFVALPGVGVYTAGAVLSIAFGQQHSALDANARRVLARVFHRRGRSLPTARRRVERVGKAAVPAKRPGEYNQALMELGSLVCTPREPKCDVCCLADICRARHLGVADSVPRPQRTRTRRGRAALAIVRRQGRILLTQRPPEGVWGGLWAFPNVELTGGEDPAAALRRLLRDEFGLEVEIGPERGRLTYGIMNRRVDLAVYEANAIRGRPRSRSHETAHWIRPDNLNNYALPAPHRRAAGSLLR